MPGPTNLKKRATDLLYLLCNEKDLSKGAAYLDANMIQYRDDRLPVVGAEQFLETWGKAIQAMPDFQIEVKDVIQEGNKVWAYCKISGLPGGVEKNSVDMSIWNEDGSSSKQEMYKGSLSERSDPPEDDNERLFRRPLSKYSPRRLLYHQQSIASRPHTRLKHVKV